MTAITGIAASGQIPGCVIQQTSAPCAEGLRQLQRLRHRSILLPVAAVCQQSSVPCSRSGNGRKHSQRVAVGGRLPQLVQDLAFCCASGPTTPDKVTACVGFVWLSPPDAKSTRVPELDSADRKMVPSSVASGFTVFSSRKNHIGRYIAWFAFLLAVISGVAGQAGAWDHSHHRADW